MAASTDIIKLKIRRGTNSQRKLVILDQGEIGWTTNTRRLYVGDGTTIGGLAAGLKVFGTVLTFSDPVLADEAVQGDIAYISNILYALTAASHTGSGDWRKIAAVPDRLSIAYNPSNELSILTQGISGFQLHTSTVNSAFGTYYTGNSIGVKVDNTTIIIDPVVGLSAAGSGGAPPSAGTALNKVTNTFNVLTDNTTVSANVLNQLSVIGISNDSITGNMIKISTLGPGLSGGFGAAGGSTVRVLVDNSTILLVNGVLSAAPAGAIPFNSILPAKINDINLPRFTQTNAPVFLPYMEIATNGMIQGLTGTDTVINSTLINVVTSNKFQVVYNQDGNAYCVPLYMFATSGSFVF